jgi:IclR family acetate operon transcriptional repressor
VVAAQTQQRSFVPALSKGLALLELLAVEGPLTLAQVERHSGLNRTMSYRLLRVMGEMGYVTHDPVRHRYDLGSSLLSLGAKAAARISPPSPSLIWSRSARNCGNPSAWVS